MAKDAELDRLKAAQDLAFQRKQNAFDTMQRAWEKLSVARDSMNRAHEAKQRAFDYQNSSWQSLQRLRDSYGPRIEQLNSSQEAAYQNMKNAYESACSAYSNRNGAMAASYAEDGRRYKAEAQGYVAERRRLVDELRKSKEAHDATKQDFLRAKDDFNRAKRDFEKLREDHGTAKKAFQDAKSAFDKAVENFKNRLEVIKSENSKRQDDNRRLAERAGVPYQYLENVKVRRDSDGTINFYFGGIGDADGQWHGHIATDSFGKVIYRRMPQEDHGAKNFTGANGVFNGQPAKIVFSDRGNSNRIDIYFGGADEPDGHGHSHITVIKDNVRYWREGGKVYIDDRKNL